MLGIESQTSAQGAVGKDRLLSRKPWAGSSHQPFPVLSLPVWTGMEVEHPLLGGSLRGVHSHAHLLV